MNPDDVQAPEPDELTATDRPWSVAAKAAVEEAVRELPADAAYNDPRVQYLLSANNLIATKQAFEAGWIGQRMSWLVISQSFLFSAFATAATHRDSAVLSLMQWLVPVMGLVQAAATYVAILAAGQIDGELYKTRSLLDIGLRLYAPGMRHLPPLGNVRIGRAYRSRLLGGLPSRIIPVTLILAWVVLLGTLLLRHLRPNFVHRWLAGA